MKTSTIDTISTNFCKMYLNAQNFNMLTAKIT